MGKLMGQEDRKVIKEVVMLCMMVFEVITLD